MKRKRSSVRFNILELKLVLHVLSVILILLLANSVNHDVSLRKTLESGEVKVLNFSTLEQAKCNLRKVSNRHLKLKNDDGELYTVLMNKLSCRNYSEDKIIVKCNGFDCVDSGYEINSVLFYIKIIGVIILIIVNILLFFNRIKL